MNLTEYKLKIDEFITSYLANGKKTAGQPNKFGGWDGWQGWNGYQWDEESYEEVDKKESHEDGDDSQAPDGGNGLGERCRAS